MALRAHRSPKEIKPYKARVQPVRFVRAPISLRFHPAKTRQIKPFHISLCLNFTCYAGQVVYPILRQR